MSELIEIDMNEDIADQLIKLGQCYPHHEITVRFHHEEYLENKFRCIMIVAEVTKPEHKPYIISGPGKL